MNISFHCFEGCTVKKLLCECFSKDEKEKVEKKIIYENENKQIIILNTPQLQLNYIVKFKDLHESDISIFTYDEEKNIRYINSNNFLYNFLNEDMQSLNPNLVNVPIQNILPEYILNFLQPIYEQTLKGQFLQLSILWMTKTYIIRTFPVFNNNKNVLAGIIVMTPWNININETVNCYQIKNENRRIERQINNKSEIILNKPEIQKMISSGRLKSTITPNNKEVINVQNIESNFSVVRSLQKS
jgi:hypothetical protein